MAPVTLGAADGRVFYQDGATAVAVDEKTGELQCSVAVGEHADHLRQLNVKSGEGVAGVPLANIRVELSSVTAPLDASGNPPSAG